jgi:hypothetical protein
MESTKNFVDVNATFNSISILEELKAKGRSWKDLSAQYGVENPEPPWKVTLETTCDLLAGDSCYRDHNEIDANDYSLAALDRRNEEDELSASLYKDVPYPENQLLSLAHSMIQRGHFDENELKSCMASIKERLLDEDSPDESNTTFLFEKS